MVSVNVEVIEGVSGGKYNNSSSDSRRECSRMIENGRELM